MRQKSSSISPSSNTSGGKSQSVPPVRVKGVTEDETADDNSTHTGSYEGSVEMREGQSRRYLHPDRVQSAYISGGCSDRDSGLSSQQLYLSTSTPDLRDFDSSQEETPEDLYQNLLKEPENGEIMDVEPYTTAQHKRRSKEVMDKVTKRISNSVSNYSSKLSSRENSGRNRLLR